MEINKKCQVFTPPNYVNILLDEIGYNRSIYGKSFLENSCGTGNVLEEAVRRYLKDCRRLGLTDVEIKRGLRRDICGVEIDSKKIKICKKRLSNIAKEYGLTGVRWNIIDANYLKLDPGKKFDFISGNPPYINYYEIDDNELEYIRGRFSSCKKGKADYCYAFVEKSIEELSDSGKMSYLIPSSMFKTVSGEVIRDLLKPDLKKIIDYSDGKIFKDALVKSSVIVVDKRKSNSIAYELPSCKQSKRILKSSLDKKWVFSDNNKGSNRFGDFYKASHVVATLKNDVFALSDPTDKDKKYLYFGKNRIEKGILRKSASPKALQQGKDEWLIFPYRYSGGKLVRYSEEDLKQTYPYAYMYLSENKAELEARDADETAKWFEFGRSQALEKINREKLLLSSIVTKKVEVFMLGARNIPYAGIFILPKTTNNNYSLFRAKELLESDRYYEYVTDVGVSISGTSYRITSKDIENYRF